MDLTLWRAHVKVHVLQSQCDFDVANLFQIVMCTTCENSMLPHISKTLKKIPVIIRHYNHCKHHKYFPGYESSGRATVCLIRWEVIGNMV